MIKLASIFSGGFTKYIILGLLILIAVLSITVAALAGSVKALKIKVNSLTDKVTEQQALVDAAAKVKSALNAQLKDFDTVCRDQLSARDEVIRLLRNKSCLQSPRVMPPSGRFSSAARQGAITVNKDGFNEDIVTESESINAVDNINGYLSGLRGED